jgi:hypothetical protein
MSEFILFLQSECPMIQAFVDEVPNINEDFSTINYSIADFADNFSPQLQKCLLEEEKVEVRNQEVTDLHQQKRRKIEEFIPKWDQKIRIAIFQHLSVFQMNIPLLMNVVESYRFDLSIGDLVEMVRMYDILGAEKRLREYEIALWMTGESKLKVHQDRLPICFQEHLQELKKNGGRIRKYMCNGIETIDLVFITKI